MPACCVSQQPRHNHSTNIMPRLDLTVGRGTTGACCCSGTDCPAVAAAAAAAAACAASTRRRLSSSSRSSSSCCLRASSRTCGGSSGHVGSSSRWGVLRATIQVLVWRCVEWCAPHLKARCATHIATMLQAPTTQHTRRFFSSSAARSSSSCASRRCSSRERSSFRRAAMRDLTCAVAVAVAWWWGLCCGRRHGASSQCARQGPCCSPQQSTAHTPPGSQARTHVHPSATPPPPPTHTHTPRAPRWPLRSALRLPPGCAPAPRPPAALRPAAGAALPLRHPRLLLARAGSCAACGVWWGVCVWVVLRMRHVSSAPPPPAGKQQKHCRLPAHTNTPFAAGARPRRACGAPAAWSGACAGRPAAAAAAAAGAPAAASAARPECVRACVRACVACMRGRVERTTHTTTRVSRPPAHPRPPGPRTLGAAVCVAGRAAPSITRHACCCWCSGCSTVAAARQTGCFADRTARYEARAWSGGARRAWKRLWGGVAGRLLEAPASRSPPPIFLVCLSFRTPALTRPTLTCRAPRRAFGGTFRGLQRKHIPELG
jgi:hypothetical protein